MALKSKIEWTDATWNPVTGCSKTSSGCKYCYAERMAKRLQAMGQPRYKDGFQLTLHRDLIRQPFKWIKPRIIFVCSMSDLFHEKIPLDFIQEVFNTVAHCPQHIFQVLTKRSDRLREISHELIWPENLWIGVSVEDKHTVYRISDLKQVPAKVRFLSCEPLLGPLGRLPLHGIQWVIVGGESGPGARPMKMEWVQDILSQCSRLDVPFFFKQWGGVRKKPAGRVLNGKIYDELPRSAYNHPASQLLISSV